MLVSREKAMVRVRKVVGRVKQMVRVRGSNGQGRGSNDQGLSRIEKWTGSGSWNGHRQVQAKIRESWQ